MQVSKGWGGGTGNICKSVNNKITVKKKKNKVPVSESPFPPPGPRTAPDYKVSE